MVGAQWLGYALLALLILIFVVRPGMKLARVRLAPPAVADREIVDLKDPVVERAGAGGVPALAESGVGMLAQGGGRRGVMPVVPLLEDYELPPAGSPVDVLVDHLKVLAAKEPERVAEVVRQWVQKNG
jgi:flagellar M-ring protein FliF